MNDITLQLKSIFDSRMKVDELFSKHTNFRIGGPAKWFVEIASADELVAAIKIATENYVKCAVLGGGSNVLASDEGFDGLIVKMVNRDIEIFGTHVKAGAGVLSSLLARETAKAGLKGFEWAVTLPGTVGGAVRGNAGCFGGEMKDFVKEVEVLRGDEIITLSNKDLQFSYRDSIIKHNNDIIISVTFDLQEGNVEELNKRMEEIIQKRKSVQPMHVGSAGCVFRNFEFKNVEEIEKLKKEFDVPQIMIEKKEIAAGWLIDQMDLKGKKIGDAQISEAHANFIVNLGKATASDIVQLVALIKTQARNRFGINLKEEVQYIGFDN